MKVSIEFTGRELELMHKGLTMLAIHGNELDYVRVHNLTNEIEYLMQLVVNKEQREK